jgi:hypothetical protein
VSVRGPGPGGVDVSGARLAHQDQEISDAPARDRVTVAAVEVVPQPAGALTPQDLALGHGWSVLAMGTGWSGASVSTQVCPVHR